jgi:poly-gamma-glutamate synthesis protein (capsule biosynthesis protein)
VDWSWPWGDALDVFDAAGCDARIMNLETSITTSGDFHPAKGVHYRMHPANVPALTVARPDVCVLANNHVLDFGRQGLEETLRVLGAAGLPVAGAGLTLAAARAPAVIPVSVRGPDSGSGGGPGGIPGRGPAGDSANRGLGPSPHRILVVACGTPSSGVPLTWAAAPSHSGIQLIPTLTDKHADQLCEQLAATRRAGDVAVASIHWGSNWGYPVEHDQVRFAHRLVDGGIDIVHGHSSHHPRPLEVYRGKLILYGCGDFINDYEGISGHERYRDDLRLLYLPRVDSTSGELLELHMAPFQARQLRLRHASLTDTRWLQRVLTDTSRSLGSRIDLEPDGNLILQFPPGRGVH